MSINPSITIEIRTNYGTDHIYVTSEHAPALQRLTGRKTITRDDIRALTELGFLIVEPATTTIIHFR